MTISSLRLEKVLEAFCQQPIQYRYHRLGQGNINDTYLIQTTGKAFILQRINEAVFPEPEKVVANSARFSEHMARKVVGQGRQPWFAILPTLDGATFHRDEQGGIWRAQHYIDNSRVYETVQNVDQALAIGRCLAHFHRTVEDIPLSDLEVVLPDFHHLPRYLEKYDAVQAVDCRGGAECDFCRRSIADHRSTAHFFEDALQHGDLHPGVVHGDPKVANILFSSSGNNVLTLIDLDTAGPGLVLQDIGDCLRSCCLVGGERGDDKGVVCDVELVLRAVEGYLEQRVLCPFELRHIPTALQLITFELGLRFFTDYLLGNRYFKVCHEGDNLHRAGVQFRLLQSIDGQRNILEERIAVLVDNDRN